MLWFNLKGESMAFNIENYYSDFITQMYSAETKVVVPAEFHKQVNSIDGILKNDVTGMISTIVDFMVQSATVPVKFESKNNSLNKIFNEWKETINSDVNIDIPMGFRALSEQYFRERWRSSFIVLNINWGKINGYIMPVHMWFSDGGSVWVDRQGTDLKTTKYYIGKGNNTKNQLTNGPKKSSIVRKPYNMWYDQYPTPYLVKKGALYHALVKQVILSKQTQAVQQAFPNMLAIKMGNDMAMKRGEMPKNQDFIDMKKKFIDLKNDGTSRTANNGLVGAFPYDVNFENLLPDFKKVLDADIMSGTDRNLLMALGLIEFKGFSTNREESVLNPKPMVSEIEDGVEDYMQLIGDVIFEIQRRNKLTKRNFSAKDVTIGHDPIKSLLTDNMKLLIRSLYDRGLLSKEDTLEGTTAYKFMQQVEKRKSEMKDNLDEIMEAPVIMNQDNKTTPDNRENSDPNMEKSPAKKKSETDVQARVEMLTVTQKDVFMKAFDRCKENCEALDTDEDFKYITSFEFANDALETYLNDSIRKNADLPEEILALDSTKQMSFRKTFNLSLKSGYTLSEAIEEANKAIK